MKIRSSKVKGHRLEQWIRDKLKEHLKLSEDDVRVPVGSETGGDIKLTKNAQKVFPYSIEAKNREIFKTLYGFYDQAASHYIDLEPVVIIKMNRKKPLVILDFEHFMELLKSKH